MADRTVKVKLTADVSEYTASLAKAAALTRGLGTEVERSVDRDVAPAMRRSGEKSGGLLAQGMRSGFLRKSPLIVAGVTAALAAGAPLLLASATTLFGAVGGIAAAQSLEVRRAWTDLGHEIRDGAVEDASVLVPVYERMAGKIGAAFQRMRPELRDAFEAAGPQIDSFTDSLTQAAENALPGMVRAVERGGPVIEGLGSLMESIGTGISDMFDAMSDDNAEAAGRALEAIGDALEEALPLLGELLGTGAELATVVLPPLADALGVVNDVAHALGPVLPTVAAGFAAMKVAQAAAGWVGGLGTSFATLSAKGAAAYGTTGKITGAIGGLIAGIGPLGATVAAGTAVFAGYSAMQERAAAQADRLATSIRAGGEEADKVRGAFALATSQNEVFESALDDVNEALRRQWEAMSPLEQAQSKVAEWTATLAYRMKDESASAEEVAIAQQRLAYWTGQVEGEQSALEMAIDGVTSAMIDQANQAMAAIDSGFAYRDSVNQLEDAQLAYNQAVSEFGAGSEQAQRAQLGLEEQNYRVAQSWGQQQADLSSLSADSAEYARIIQDQTLVKLYELQAAAGPEMAAAIGQQIAALQASGVSLSASAQLTANLSSQVQGLSTQIHEVPGQKFVRIDAPTAEQKQRLADLGYQVVNLPDGDILVTADTDAANAAIDYAARRRWAVITTVTEAVGGPSGTGRGIPLAATGGGIENGRVQHFDIGGAVRGAGGPTADRVPAMLSNGEHVWTASEVQAAGGQAAVAAMRRMVLSGREQSGWSPGSGSAGAASQTREVHITAVASPNERSLAKAIADRQRDLEFLHG